MKMEANTEEQRGVVRFLVAEGAATRHKVKTPWNAVGRNHPIHDNVRPRTANLVRNKLQRFAWKTLQHPPYNPVLSPCDFHIFDDLTKDIRGCRFHSDEEVYLRVGKVVDPSVTFSFYKTGIDHLVSQCDKCINTCGNYL